MGFIWLMGAFSKPGFPNRSSAKSAALASIAALLIFVSQLTGQFNSLSAATSVDLFTFIGCILGVIGVFRSLYLRFPQEM
jgi:hypothetical protein